MNEQDTLLLIRESRGIIVQDPETVIKEELIESGTDDLNRYLNRSGSFPICEHTETEFFPLGEDKFAAMLEELGIPGFLVIGQNSYAVNTDLATCDSYDYLDGDPEALNQFHGEYMIQYSWAEESTYQFYE